jgi:hypothetical protein
VYGDANLAKNSIRFQGDTCATVKVELAKNETPYQENFIPLGDRFHYYQALPSGRVLVSAKVTKDLVREYFVLNPVTNVTTKYSGEEGEVPLLTDPGWIATDLTVPEGDVGMFAQAKDWRVYVGRLDNTVVYCKDNATGMVTTLPGTDPDIQYRSLTSYSN